MVSSIFWIALTSAESSPWLSTALYAAMLLLAERQVLASVFGGATSAFAMGVYISTAIVAVAAWPAPGMILSLLVLPLYIPLLIFASSAVDSAAAGLPVTAHLSLIAALLVLALSLSPFATAAALRVSLS